MIELNNFGIDVPEKVEQRGNEYFVMQHGSKFKLTLVNNTWNPCSAEVFFQGKNMGKFLLEARSRSSIERSAFDNGCFTAYKHGTQEARDAGTYSCDDDAGLVKVVFTPGRKKCNATIAYVYHYPVYWWPYNGLCWEDDYCDNSIGHESYTLNCTSRAACDSSTSTSYNCNTRGLSSGGIGLSGESSQKFKEVEDLEPIDDPTTIYARLAFAENAARALVGREDVKRSTGIPKRL